MKTTLELIARKYTIAPKPAPLVFESTMPLDIIPKRRNSTLKLLTIIISIMPTITKLSKSETGTAAHNNETSDWEWTREYRNRVLLLILELVINR